MEKGKARILIIDDDPDITRAIQVILESKGYIVTASNCKHEGGKKLEEFKPDLIILDVMMESMSDGFDFSLEIKSTPGYERIPVLLYTGIDQKTGVNFKSAVGNTDQIKADGYLEKPATPQALLAEIERLLSL
ncbi:MAG: response regulator [Bacteroidales bacterium]|jgi:CheY-like chemotaxis protein